MNIALAEVVVVRHEPPFRDRPNDVAVDVAGVAPGGHTEEHAFVSHLGWCPVEWADHYADAVIGREVRRGQLRRCHRLPVTRKFKPDTGQAVETFDDDIRRRLGATILDT